MGIDLRWSDEYACGIGEVDRQHRRLFELAGRVAEAGADGDTAERVGTIDALLDCALRHFADEEQLMLRHALAADFVDQHRQQHRAFVGEVRAMRELALERSDALSSREFIGSWLVSHILGSDQAMAQQIDVGVRGAHRTAANDSPGTCPTEGSG